MAATLKTRLPMIAAELRPRVSAAVKDSAERIAEGAQELVPIRTEELHDAIHIERVGPATYSVVAGDENVFYGHLVEHGTSHSAPRPFLVPAMEMERPRAIAQITGVLRGL